VAAANMKIYILGLRHNFRGDQLYDFLKKQNFDVEVFWGYTSDDLLELRSFTNVRKSEFLYGRNLTWPEIACTLGHRKILEKAISENLDSVLILEDDVVINDPNWLKSQIENSVLSSDASMTLLLTDSRLCLTSRIILQRSKFKSFVRIHSNPSPTAAYLFNRAALNRLKELSVDNWYGVQADFPPVFSRELKFVDASTVTQPYPIALVEIGSTMSSARKRNMSPQKYALWYFHKILFLGYFQGRSYGFDFKTYFYHFIGRRIAWKLSRAKMPTQVI